MKLLIRQALNHDSESDRLKELSHLMLSIDAAPYGKLDPYAQDYKELVLQTYSLLSGNSSYSPEINEKTDDLDRLAIDIQPIPYRFGDSITVGQHLSAYGCIMQNLSVRAQDAILEYGCGEGQLAISLARIGCKVYGIDIEPRSLRIAEDEIRKLGFKNVRLKQGRFGEGFENKSFDRIIFYEAFHHCLNHQEVLDKLHGHLKPDGAVVFAGEPIIRNGSEDELVLPYPWGLRLDGEAIRAISEFGWMELGYRESYFVDLLMRCGYKVVYRPCRSTWRGNCYIAKSINGKLEMGEDYLIKVWNKEISGWHSSEGSFRWTDGDATLPLPHLGYQSITLELSNLQSRTIQILVSISARSETIKLGPGKNVSITMPYGSNDKYLSIECDSFVPSEYDETIDDSRRLGVAVRSITFG